ncbi:hypothetical protein uvFWCGRAMDCOMC203_058 [Freshwater phage uvFW-CGR-AMD-COM-C203]|nr:hypothetical protein uvFWCGRAMDCOMC203_058 [Freshwater phage uvFW-CGR-AMD-COM-C203]
MAVLSSGYTTTEPIQIVNPEEWSFTAVESPTTRVTQLRVQQPLNSSIVESYGVFKPLGASKTIVVATSIYGIDGSYEFTTQGETEWDDLYPVLTYQGILHVHDPLGRQKYVRFVDRTWTEVGDIDNLIRNAKVNYYEVEAP